MSRTRRTLQVVAPRTVNLTDPRYQGVMLYNIVYTDPATGETVLKERMLFADDDCPEMYLDRLGISIEDAIVTPSRSKRS
jgi:hypothetical protein